MSNQTNFNSKILIIYGTWFMYIFHIKYYRIILIIFIIPKLGH